MTGETEDGAVRAGLREGKMRERLIRLAFGGDPRRRDEFCEAVRAALPPDTAAVLRGSAVTGYRHDDHAPFDADGPGTSDLDLTLVGDEGVGLYSAFWIPGINSRPLSDKDPDWVMFVREHLMGQPYLMLVGKLESP